MKKKLIHLLFIYQKAALIIFHYIYSFFGKASKKYDWVIGTEEIASVLKNIGDALPNSYTVCLRPTPSFYSFKYDLAIGTNGGMAFIKSLILGPIILAKLMQHSSGFIYIASSGFLISQLDGRNFELAFLKRHRKKIVCYFTGTEIRSFKLLDKFSVDNEIDVITTYQRFVMKGIDSVAKEKQRINLATSAESHADHIFNPSTDQMTYIKRATHPFIYFYPDERFELNSIKFKKIEHIKIVHAPSSPIIKGTPLVRAAIKKLKLEGYKFDYIELIGVSNETVLKELKTAHIVLNEFYAFVPGIFGIEAMASHCALLTSANEDLEPTLGKGANSAWLVTPYWDIYHNLKWLLDDTSRIKPIADKGFEWARRTSCSSAGRAQLLAIINK